jgi:hypothetical protein
MIRLTSLPSGQTLHSTALIVFDATTGEIHGTTVHSEFGAPTRTALDRNRDRLLAEIAHQTGKPAAALRTYEADASAFADRTVTHFEPVSGRPVTRFASQHPRL